MFESITAQISGSIYSSSLHLQKSWQKNNYWNEALPIFSMLSSYVILHIVRENAAWIVALVAFFSTFPTSQSKVAHLGRLTCGRFIQESTRVKHFKHGIHRFMWIFDRFTRAANFLENSHFLFAAIPLTPLHVKCSPIEISPRALQFLASVPNIQIYCTAPSTEQRNTTWENCWME